ncbi:MAG: cytochrome-c peroxidase [Candidatus Kapabacteria bacterium]|nr:cytochrome-c peroxidase [Candidatus Kapabacteria bacterium]
MAPFQHLHLTTMHTQTHHSQARHLLICCLLVGLSMSACTTNGTTPIVTNPNEVAPNLSTTYTYANTTFPKHIADALAQVDNTPSNNPITDAGATLGRVLFYDTQLSKNNTISCGSCHKQELSFTDDAIKSKGFQGGLTARHSMPLLSVRFYQSGKMFWDERAATLEAQVLMPIQDEVEMGMTLPELEQRLATLSYYPSLFQKAFGSTAITSERVALALAQFVRAIVPYQSKYDRVKQGLESFTTSEARGEQLFTNGRDACSSCHPPPMFITSNPARPFGLPNTGDNGADGRGNFKSPSLRNTAERTALFHNGSIADIEQMFNGRIREHGVAGGGRADLTAFLRTLTDNTIKTDPKFSNPFPSVK